MYLLAISSASSIARRSSPWHRIFVKMTLNYTSSTVCLFIYFIIYLFALSNDELFLTGLTGMDDVLPKPFTRKSLLDMLEKHLVHLKNTPATAIDPISATPMTTHNSAAQSIKEDSSPGQSPAASMNNWQSPGQLQGMSPVHLNVQQVPQYMQPITPTGTAFAVDQNGVQYATAAPTAISQPSVRPQHRRQVSDMSSAPDQAGYAKRQRMYQNPQMMPQIAGQQNGWLGSLCFIFLNLADSTAVFSFFLLASALD